MIVPYSDLSADALKGIIEEFVLREGTEYGVSEVSLPKKVDQVMRQLEKGDAHIVYDEETETCNLVPKRPPATAE